MIFAYSHDYFPTAPKLEVTFISAAESGRVGPLVDVQIGSWVFPGIEVVGDERSGEIVLGRDVLNRLRIVLDGPREITEFAD